MALIKCHECGTEVSTDAKTCPKCGATPRTAINKLASVITLIFVLAIGWYFFGGGLEQQAQSDMSKIEHQVAADAVRQYNIAKSGGTATDLCVHAGMVSASFLQAKDEQNYRVWKKIEAADCEKAGVPVQ